MKKLLLTLSILLLALPKSYSQQLFMIVYSGNVSDSEKQLENRLIYKIPANAKMTFDSKSVSVIYNASKILDVCPPAAQKFTGAELQTKLGKATAISAGGLLAYMNKYHELSEAKELTEGKPIAGVRRLNKSTELKADGIFPADSATVIAENVRLQWDPATTAAGDELIVTFAKTDESVLRQPAPDSGSIFVKADKEGTYNWKIYASMEDKASIDRIFIRPNAATTRKLLDNLVAFKLQTAAMSEDTKKLLLEEYLIANNIVVN